VLLLEVGEMMSERGTGRRGDREKGRQGDRETRRRIE
jgi:hypothetical protein